MELRAEDLRCNNILFVDDGKGEPYQITIKGINTINSGHVYDEDDSIHGLDYLKPIPLTEEWLLKLGFEKTNKLFFFINETEHSLGFHIRLVKNGFKIVINGKRIILDSVHQVQNLYYAIENKELQVL